MAISVKDVEQVLSKMDVIEIENEIAKNANCKVIRENASVLMSLTLKNIETSGLELKDIENLLINHRDEVIRFADLFLQEEKLNALGLGISFTYAIYLIYLRNKSEEDLLNYLRRRKIPQAKKVCEQLQNSFAKLRKEI
jgi:hypothetical protein